MQRAEVWLKNTLFKSWRRIMKKEIFEENKGRWMLFEQVSSTTSAIIWAAVAVIVVLGALYFFYMQ
jgi:hypothetical protein